MKKTISTALLKSLGCFSILSIGAVAVAFATGLVDARALGLCISFLLLSAYPFLQMAWFSDALIKRAAYLARIAGFGACYYALLLAAAYIGGWMPFSASTVAFFTAIFFVVLAIISLGYHLHFKRMAGSYQAALERYHREECPADGAEGR